MVRESSTQETDSLDFPETTSVIQWNAPRSAEDSCIAPSTATELEEKGPLFLLLININREEVLRLLNRSISESEESRGSAFENEQLSRAIGAYDGAAATGGIRNHPGVQKVFVTPEKNKVIGLLVELGVSMGLKQN